ncbi:MAG: glycine cleavage system protein GcvH [Hyphomicrobiaceae bacterium TMED74]|nr:glycine cleavage system protein H [Filomicrobium sp.]RPG37757.1 MAG: glycine cleavage system protein GcvH [Hyphomicrobiaceae bacterium TMED74]
MSQEYYSEDHEYIRVDGDIATIGITNHAQEQLGDVVYAEVPEVGRKVSVGEAAAVVESVKAASEVYAPVSGEVTEANGDLDGNPALVSEDAEGAAWFFKVRLADKSELDKLMSREQYDKFVAENS